MSSSLTDAWTNYVTSIREECEEESCSEVFPVNDSLNDSPSEYVVVNSKDGHVSVLQVV